VSASNWRDRLQHLAGEVGRDLRRAGEAAGIIDGPGPHGIAAYRGYGNGSRVLVQGRALECPNIPPAAVTDSIWRNLISTYKRIDSNALAHARVHIGIGGVEREVVADDEGFFREWIDLPSPLRSDEPWRRAQLRLLSPLRPDQPDVHATALIRVPGASASFGVISDLDDTVIQSRVANFLQAVRTVMLGNARTRLPVPGVAAFYQALERGGDGARKNPIFYVSSSPWNIHDLIAEFMELQHIPAGPICLRDWDIDLSALAHHRHKGHKEPLIREILDLYPNLPFILIGDSSQQDPEIYRAIIDAYPGRISAIYIRNVDPHPERLESIRKLEREVLAAGSSLVLADDTFAAATHAAEHGWITKESLPGVREEKKADTGESGAKSGTTNAPDEPPSPTIVVE
jgi:phosphatidate phosphatase APP1